MTSDPPADVLLVGCGDLGERIGRRLAEDGHRVLALRRRAELVPAPLLGLGVDLTRDRPRLPPLALGLLVVALTARPRTEAAYRATYVEGMARALDAVAAAGQRPDRALLVSSTGVLGTAGPDAPGVLVDEDSPAAPTDPAARVLLEAEEAFLERLPHGTVLRLSGLYGGGSRRLLDRVEQGRVEDQHRWTNRIHRDDAAAAAVHLLTREPAPEWLYLGTDDEPAQLGDVAAYLAARLGAPEPPPVDPASAHGKRLSNARLRATGWTPRHPSYREGYAAVLEQLSRAR